jgi:uncharacterized protein HemX
MVKKAKRGRMKEYYSEIAIATAGIITAGGAWFLGGRQQHKNHSDEVLTRGADQIVDTSNKLLETLQNLLTEERARVKEERVHKQNCEDSLAEHKRMIEALSKKVKQLENTIK